MRINLGLTDRLRFTHDHTSDNDFGSMGTDVFTVPAGTTGVVTEICREDFNDFVIIKFDQHFPFLDEWENSLQVWGEEEQAMLAAHAVVEAKG